MHINYGLNNYCVRYLKRFLANELKDNTNILGEFDKKDQQNLIKYLNLPNVKSMFEVQKEIREIFPELESYFNIELKRNPLLVIYLIDLKPTEEVKLTEPLVGLGIGIPRLKKPQELSYSYKVNKKWLQENYDIDDDEFEADDIGGYDA